MDTTTDREGVKSMLNPTTETAVEMIAAINRAIENPGSQKFEESIGGAQLESSFAGSEPDGSYLYGSDAYPMLRVSRSDGAEIVMQIVKVNTP